MEPVDRPPAPITGTIAYTAADLKLLRAQFSAATPLEFWQSTLAAGALGAIIGYGIGALTPWFGTGGAWFALVGALVMPALWCWHITRLARPLDPIRPQALTLDAAGLRLTTDKADTLMRWPYLTHRQPGPDYLALRTEDNTWIILRPTHFADRATYEAAIALIEARVNPR